MIRRQAILILLLSLPWVAPTTGAGEATVKERAITILQPIGKRVMTEGEAKEVASLGPNVLPVVYDALFSTNEFKKGYWEGYALRVLVHMQDTNTVSKIKEYIARDARLPRRFEALRAILEIENSEKTRNYVVEQCTHWMTHDDYRHDVEFGFDRLLDANIPSADRVGIANRTALDKFIFRGQIFRHLARRADDISIPILKHFLAVGNHELTSLVDDCIRDGLRLLDEEARKFSSLDNFNGAQQPITKQDMDKRHSEIVTCIARLKNEFPKAVSDKSKVNKAPEDTARKLADPQCRRETKGKE
jgi:hypothetical protein